ncbi:MAG TPA: M50 family peptidase, partial [Rhodobacteraceae bacterium]|nr:M50 family peptidase [Paracoccaceae bacterium]
MKVLRGHWQLMLITAVVFALWNTPVVVPLKILIVFFHELSHAIAAWLTGGSVESISLSPQQGGLTATRGGNVFLTMSAGYLGSLLIGVLVFLVAVRSHADRVLMGVLGAVLLLVAALFIREWFAL